MNLQQFIEDTDREFDEKFQYALEGREVSNSPRESAFHQLKAYEAVKSFYRTRTIALIEKIAGEVESIGECCDGECNHDDCCGKIPENCTHTVSQSVEGKKKVESYTGYAMRVSSKRQNENKTHAEVATAACKRHI